MHRWLLPEAIEDALPSEAWHVETLRRTLLDEFRRHGYEYVIPPLLEYVDSLLTGSGRDLDLRTFKLVDQISGRTMGVRADIAPQVARIDAHLLNRQGVARLCYCGSVLHTRPSSLTATRQPLQLGAELYGHAGIDADAEILRLLARALQLSGVAATRIDLGHVGVFRALTEEASLDSEQIEALRGALQGKDVPGLQEMTADLSESCCKALLALPGLYGGVEVLSRARAVLPASPAVKAALDELQTLADSLGDLPVSIDLADLRGLHYHSGIVFAAYCAGYPGAIALGGRYDKVGQAFGRDRAATGFSLDLRELARQVGIREARHAIAAPLKTDTREASLALNEIIVALRAAGEIVISILPGESLENVREAGCDRQLHWQEGRWQVLPLEMGV